MNCLRCNTQFIEKPYLKKKFCSKQCCKLYLKSLYRKRNREKISLYRRLYRIRVKREPNVRGEVNKFLYLRGKNCRICGTESNLTLNHIVPLSAGGKNEKDNFETLCGRCNTREYHRIVKDALYFLYNHRCKK